MGIGAGMRTEARGGGDRDRMVKEELMHGGLDDRMVVGLSEIEEEKHTSDSSGNNEHVRTTAGTARHVGGRHEKGGRGEEE